jgi:rhamnosyltransferase subunit B
MQKIVIVTKGTYGDVVPFLSIGMALRARGNNVVFVSQCHYEWAARRVGLEFDSWDTKEQYDAFVCDGAKLDTPHEMKEFARTHIFPQLKDEYEVIRKHCNDPNTIILSRHLGSFAASFLAEQCNLPLASVFIAPSQADCFSLYTQLCREVIGQDINELRRHFGLSVITDWNQWSLVPNLFLGCWPSSFAQPTAGWPSRVVTLGLLTCDPIETDKLPPELIHLLGSDQSPILITGGTAFWKLAKRFYSVAVEACHIAGKLAIVSCPHDQLVSDLPLNTLRFRRLPFASLMPHIAAVIHHGGASILVRTLAAGKPQLVMPFGADRPDNADRIEHLGVGIHLPPPRWNAKLIAERLSELISSRSILETCTSLAKLAQCSEGSELDKGCAEIESLAGH